MGDDEHRYLLEFVPVGTYIKVTAMDPVTLLEVSIVGDAKAPQKQLERLAVRKLEYRLSRERGG